MTELVSEKHKFFQDTLNCAKRRITEINSLIDDIDKIKNDDLLIWIGYDNIKNEDIKNRILEWCYDNDILIIEKKITVSLITGSDGSPSLHYVSCLRVKSEDNAVRIRMGFSLDDDAPF